MIPLRIGQAEIRLVSEIERMPLDATWLFGNADLDVIRANKSWLDGRFIDPATDQLVLSFHSYLLRVGGRHILIDTCNGNDKERPSMLPWHRLRQPYLENLAALGVRPDDIDIVMCTHLHADHVGWNTRLENGRWVPTFGRARYVMAKAEFEHWHARHAANPEAPVNRGSFVDSVLPVVEAQRADMVESDFGIDLAAGLSLAMRPAPGHTAGNVHIDLRGRDGRALFSGDVIHHPVQFAAPWLANHADFDVAQAHATRMELMRSCADADIVLLTGHFPGPTAGRVVSAGEQFRFNFIEAESP
jgi:glyoxylase-like metal-dependent hydrolase (beta-lactamase superfamily II)